MDQESGRPSSAFQHVYHLMAARYDGRQYDRQRDDLIILLREKYQAQVHRTLLTVEPRGTVSEVRIRCRECPRG